jgi:hypothetical protein
MLIWLLYIVKRKARLREIKYSQKESHEEAQTLVT